jgi:hypothetical protein
MMKMRWISRIRAPYGGEVRWQDPITSVVCVGTTYEMLMDRAYAQRKANGVPTGLAFESEIEESLCRDYPAECEGGDPRVPRRYTLGFDVVLRGTKVLLAVIAEQAKHLIGLAQSPLVEQQTAEYRAMVCANCPMNTDFMRGCTRCEDVLNLVRQIKGSRTTRHDKQLKACQICGCSTEAHVWVRLDLLAKGVTQEMKTQFAAMNEINGCWKQV